MLASKNRILTPPLPIMTGAEVCKVLKIHRTTLHRMITKGEIPFFRIGSNYRFERTQIDLWRQEREVPK
jgi:excisionase family DNA binding protein